MARKRKKQQSIEKLKVKEKKARVNGSLGGDIVIFVFLCLLGAFMVFPLYYSVIQSMKPVEELFVFPPKLYVLNPTTNNFSDMFKVAASSWQVPLSRYIFNSFFITIVICICNLFVCCCAHSFLQSVNSQETRSLTRSSLLPSVLLKCNMDHAVPRNG
ncbi:MAG: hypothetical protein ACLTCP_01740 [Ruminococcus bicirculans (ex Wegman et al. 2014)]